MFLLTEKVNVDVLDYDIIQESVNGEENKKIKIKGPFLEADVKNRNQRIYPLPLLEEQVNEFKEKIKKNNALGELDHPENLTVNLQNVSHKIENLEQHKNIFIGEAVLLNTPMGKIAQELIKEGVKLGVSSRGYGDVKNGVVQKYKLITIDIVSDPSAPSAFIEGILEHNIEWILKEGVLLPKDYEDTKDFLQNFRKYDIKDIREALKIAFKKLINNIR